MVELILVLTIFDATAGWGGFISATECIVTAPERSTMNASRTRGFYPPTELKPKRKTKQRRRKGLRHVWDSIVHPRLIRENRSRKTICEIKTHLAAWERYWAEKNPRSKPPEPAVAVSEGCFSPGNKPPAVRRSDPPYNRITPQMLGEFQAWLLPGRTAKTVNNYIKSIQKLIGEAAEKHPNAFQTVLPKARSLPCKSSKDKVYFPVAHLEAIYRSCGVANWPPRKDSLVADPEQYWQTAVVLFTVMGFRTAELVSMHAKDQPITYGNFHWSIESPGFSEYESEFGWLVYTPTKQKRHKPDPLILALPEIVAKHVKSITPRDADPEAPLFPFPRSHHSFYGQWKRIVRRAGVRPKAALGTKTHKYELYHFRKTAVTMHNRNVPGSALWIVGHGDRDSERGVKIQQTHYDNTEVAAAKALMSFPIPEAFEAGVRKTKQMELF